MKGRESEWVVVIRDVYAVKVQSLLDFELSLLQNQIRTDDPLPDIMYIVDDSLKVARRIVRASDEDVVYLTICDWCIDG
jgi:hypothetical protein